MLVKFRIFFTVAAINKKNWSIESTGRSVFLFSKIYFIKVDGFTLIRLQSLANTTSSLLIHIN